MSLRASAANVDLGNQNLASMQRGTCKYLAMIGDGLFIFINQRASARLSMCFMEYLKAQGPPTI